MNIKAYHSDSVESAIRQARLELGEDAVLLDSRKTSLDERHLGVYEVRFGTESKGSPAAPPTVQTERRPAQAPEPARAETANIAGLSREIEEIRRMLFSYTQTCYLPTGQFLSQPSLARIYQDLTVNEVDAELAAQLVAGLTAAAERGATHAELEQQLAATLKSIIPAPSEIGRSGPEADSGKPRVVALVGPAGAGKTTTLAKIAVQFGLQRGRDVHLLSTDTSRVGAIGQLQLYGEILGAEWTAVDGANDLASALDSFGKKGPRAPELILIDTPGYGFSELERSRELARFLSSQPEIDVHLVLSACTKTRDLRLAIEKHRPFGPRKLLFTKLDETLSFGPLLNETLRTRWPISLLGTGQSVPEDLIPATRDMLADLVLRRELPLAEGERKRA